MAVTLSRKAFDHANELIVGGQFVFDGRDAWSEHRPSAQEENELLRRYGFAYGKWYFGINHEPEDTKANYEFSYGDFKNIHRCGGLTAESRAGQYKYYDIENAGAHLHGMIDARKDVAPPKRPRADSPGRMTRAARHSTR